MFFDQMFPKNLSVRFLLDLALNYNSVQQERLNRDVNGKIKQIIQKFQKPIMQKLAPNILF